MFTDFKKYTFLRRIFGEICLRKSEVYGILSAFIKCLRDKKSKKVNMFTKDLWSPMYAPSSDARDSQIDLIFDSVTRKSIK